jgi:dipeptidyl aminopeptidase/acylaminoacyl peptidase
MSAHTELPVPGVSEERSRFDARNPQIRAAALILLVVLLALAVGIWFATRSGSSPKTSPVPPHATAVPISIGGLKTLAAAVDQPIYWAGPEQNVQYEMTRANDGRVWLRYLPTGSTIGERTTPYLTIGTYPVDNAYAATQANARKKGSTRIDLGSGAVAYFGSAHPTSVYIAYRGSNYQIEIFDPSAGAARRLAASGQLRLAPGSKSTASGAQLGAVALDAKGLKGRVATMNGPVYWAGAQRNVKYELTLTSNGRAYVRYLPAGVAAGSQHRYLTVGTYPVQGALANIKAASKRSGAVSVDVAHGGFGFYAESSPSSVHLAYPGENYQVEVFAPSAAVAKQIASSGRLRLIR